MDGKIETINKKTKVLIKITVSCWYEKLATTVSVNIIQDTVRNDLNVST